MNVHIKNEDKLIIQREDFFNKHHNLTSVYPELMNFEKMLNDHYNGIDLPCVYNKQDNCGEPFSFPVITTNTLGAHNEYIIFNFLRNHLPDKFVQYPNGSAQFPDLLFDGVQVDLKAVNCEFKKSGRLSPNYASSLWSPERTDEAIKYYIDNEYNIDKISDPASLICITFYHTNAKGNIVIDSFKIIPMLFYINPMKDHNDWIEKSPKPSSLLQGRLTVKDKLTCDAYIDNLIDTYNNRMNKLNNGINA